MKKILIAGGAGFLGTNLCTYYLGQGYQVACVDNLSTGRRKNIASLEKDENFHFTEHDICEALPANLSEESWNIVVNLASPASPPKYFNLAVETLMVGAVGTKNLLDLALRHDARYFHASTSEVYGDPEVHPQVESYRGSVNTYGPRAMYDESKRYGEAMVYVYRTQKKVNTVIARFFNTYGPHMDPEDGRVVSNFIIQALQNQAITIFGDGKQTRSFCYVDDLVAGIVALIDSDEHEPMNLGNPGEFTMLELAERVIRLTNSSSKLTYKPLPKDDPTQRRPDISFAKKAIGWEPHISLVEGLQPTIEYFRSELNLGAQKYQEESKAGSILGSFDAA